MTCNNSSTYTAVSQRYEVFGLETPCTYPAVRGPAVLDRGTIPRRWIAFPDADTQTALLPYRHEGAADMDADPDDDDRTYNAPQPVHRTITDASLAAFYPAPPGRHCANIDCICHVRTIEYTLVPAGVAQRCTGCGLLYIYWWGSRPDLPVATDDAAIWAAIGHRCPESDQREPRHEPPRLCDAPGGRMHSTAYSDTGEYDDGPDTDECSDPADECVAFEYTAGYWGPALADAARAHIARYHPEHADLNAGADRDCDHR